MLRLGDAYHAGVLAAAQGKSEADCPYPAHSERVSFMRQRQTWLLGFRAEAKRLAMQAALAAEMEAANPIPKKVPEKPSPAPKASLATTGRAEKRSVQVTGAPCPAKPKTAVVVAPKPSAPRARRRPRPDTKRAAPRYVETRLREIEEEHRKKSLSLTAGPRQR